MPTIPRVHAWPVKRPGFITGVFWNGDDDDLSMIVQYTNQSGGNASISLETKNADRKGEFCLPTSSDVADLADTPERIRDILAAHVRMAVMIKGHAVPGSTEFEDAILDHIGSNHLQTALGTVKVKSVTIIDDQCLDIEFQKGSGTKRTYRFDHQELMNYVYVPQTQLLVVAGAIEKEFSSYVHDHPNDVLTQVQRDDIDEYLLGLEPWV